jgi:flagellar assembly protein FliH
MANLSDLLAPGAVQAAAPGWIAALASGPRFHERSFAPASNAQDAATPPDPAAAHEAALANAYARGAADERAAMAAAQAQDEAARHGLSLAFGQLDDVARAVLTQRLTEHVAALCEQVIEPALVDRAMLDARCAALAAMLGETAGQCALHLHPDDVPMLAVDTIRGWTIHPDPALPRGTLLLEHAAGAVADGPEEWRRLIAGALSA